MNVIIILTALWVVYLTYVVFYRVQNNQDVIISCHNDLVKELIDKGVVEDEEAA